MGLNQKYTDYCKPKLGKLLNSIRLDKVYHRAEFNYIYYNDNENNEIEVIDFLGGYGASLFGHNHPELVEVALENFKQKRPFNAQASCRGQAGLLCEKLNQMMYARNRRNYVIALANTGTEAIEAAIKHAELYQHYRIKAIIDKESKQVANIRKKCLSSNLKRSNEFMDILIEKIGASPDNTFENMLLSINDFNYNAFKKKPLFIGVKRGFHGKTTGAVKLTYCKLYKEPFERIGIEVHFVEDGQIDSLWKIINKSGITYYSLIINEENEVFLEEKNYINISGMFIEPLQGEGGIHIIDKDFLKACREITTQYKIPLIFDEIQCGMGRTGSFLFSEQQGVVADYYLLSKSLGGGISKISALLIDAKLYEDEFGVIHSSTFAEDDHSSAIALKALDILDRNDEIYNSCTLRGRYLVDGLERIRRLYPSVIQEVRGAGLMLGIEFQCQDSTNSGIFRLIFEQNLLGYIISGYLLHEHRIRVAPTMSSNITIRLEPSAYIGVEDCRKLLLAVERLCEIIFKQNIYELIKFIVGAETYGDYPPVENYRIEEANHKLMVTDDTGVKKVAFLGHFIEAKHLVLWNRAFSGFSEAQLDELFERLFELINPAINTECIISSITGDKVQLVFIGIFITSKIISKHYNNRNVKIVSAKIDAAVEIAKKKGCKVIGFGGFTSIVTHNCQNITIDTIGLTSGNSLTVAMGLEAMLKMADQTSIELNNACLAIVGAAGNIASVYSEILAEYVPRLILIGNKGKEKFIRKVAEKIYYNAFLEILKNKDANQNIDDFKGISKIIYQTNSVHNLLDKYEVSEELGGIIFDNLENELKNLAPIIVTSDYSYLKEANLILSASNSPLPVIFPEMLATTPVVICDIAVPADVDESVREKCKNISVIKGGLVKLPLNKEFSLPGIPLDKGEVYACMSETMVLGLSGILEDYSYGAIDKARVNKIMQLAKLHGFELGGVNNKASF